MPLKRYLFPRECSPIDVFDVVVIDASVEDSTVDDDVMVELIEVGSLGVIGPADCGPGVKPG